MGHVGRAVRAVGDVAGLGLGERPVDDVPAFRSAVTRPVVRVLDGQVGGFDGGDGRRLVGRGHLQQATAGRIAPGQVEVDLHRAAGPAGLGLADRLTGGRAAVAGLWPRQQAEVDEHLAGVDRRELRGEAVVRGHERRQVAVVHLPLGQAHRRVGALVGALDERFALGDPPVRGAVDLHVVERRVGRAVGQHLGDEAEELVLELVGDRVPDHGQVRPVGLEDVLDQRVVALLPVQPLLDVRLLADDARLEDGEVAGLRRREVGGDEVLERSGEAGLTRPRRPRGDRPRDGRVEQPYLGEIRCEPLDLDEEGAGLAVEVAAHDRRP